ncbi:hypothetical protein [Luteimonas sp. A482]
MDAHRKPTNPTPAPQPASSDCRIDIHIDSRGDVNIYNCSAPCDCGESSPPAADHTCPPTAPGACVPASLGGKPKQSRRRKLDTLLGNTRVPSALGATFFHLARRQLAGKPATNVLEQRAFATLGRLTPDLRRVLSCSLASFDTLAPGERDRLFSSEVPRDPDQPLTVDVLAQAVATELVANVGLQLFGDPDGALEERPGLRRTQPFPGGEFPPTQVRVCRVNALRTGEFLPTLGTGDYTPEEVQQRCHVILEGGQPVQVCEVQTTDCPGSSNGEVCLRVQEIEAGRAVMLEGVNFSSVETKVRLTDVATFSIVRDVDAHVRGDEQTPLAETIDGVEVPIIDCRVHDRLSFRLPDDLPPGLYDFQVMVPNDGGDPGWGQTLFSNGQRVMVVPPATARFQISSETLHARRETAPASWGSDEVGIKILAAALFPDLSASAPQSPNGGNPIRFGDVDSGESRAMEHLLFSHSQPILGGAVSILGFEVDGEEAFEKQIDSFTEAFIEVMKDVIDFIKDHLKEAGAIATKLVAMGVAGAIAAAIAVAIALAIILFVALWAPADLIIEDAIGPTIGELVALTSLNFPLPPPRQYTTAGGIKVKVTPLEKVAQQYRELREYVSDDEESRYEIVLRYNRLA